MQASHNSGHPQAACEELASSLDGHLLPKLLAVIMDPVAAAPAVSHLSPEAAIRDLRLDHVAIQVSDLDAAIALFTKLFGYEQATTPVLNTRHQVEVVFLEKPGSLPLKLLRPLEDVRRGAPKLHHVAFRTSDIDSAAEALVANGARLLSAPAPGEAFEDEPIAFLFAGGLNVELVSTDKRRGRVPRER